MKNKNLLIVGGIILAGIAGFLIYKKMKKSSGEKSPDSKPTDSSTTTGGSTSKLSDAQKTELTDALKSVSSSKNDLDIEITLKVIENALNGNSLTNDDIKKYIDILKRAKSMTDEDKNFVKDFGRKISSYKIEKVSLESTDGKTATFKVYANDKPVVIELKNGLSTPLSNKFKDFSLVVSENPDSFQIDLKKNDTVYNGWLIDKKTNKIMKMFA